MKSSFNKVKEMSLGNKKRISSSDYNSTPLNSPGRFPGIWEVPSSDHTLEHGTAYAELFQGSETKIPSAFYAGVFKL